MSELHEPDQVVGRVTHYFTDLRVAAVTLAKALKVGDRIHIRGHTTDLVQTVESIEVEHERIEGAGPGDDVALAVDGTVRANDQIFREPG